MSNKGINKDNQSQITQKHQWLLVLDFGVPATTGNTLVKPLTKSHPLPYA